MFLYLENKIMVRLEDMVALLTTKNKKTRIILKNGEKIETSRSLSTISKRITLYCGMLK